MYEENASGTGGMAMGGAVLAAIAVIMLTMLAYSQMISAQERRNVRLTEEINELQRSIEEIDGLERQKERLLARMEIIEELEKDIHRLEMITARFSNIGSVPVLNYENVPACVDATISYLKKRISKKVEINLVEIAETILKGKKVVFSFVVDIIHDVAFFVIIVGYALLVMGVSIMTGTLSNP